MSLHFTNLVTHVCILVQRFGYHIVDLGVYLKDECKRLLSASLFNSNYSPFTFKSSILNILTKLD